MSTSSEPDRPVRVGQLVVDLARRVLASDDLKGLWVEGEVSGATLSQLGHVYFTLKDSAGGLQCTLFAAKAALVALTPRDGMKVLVHGDVTVYLRDGRMQLNLDDVRPAGAGEAWLRREALKRRLAAEGLFAPERKRPMPTAPRRIGVVTSPTGAAWRDVQTVVARRDPSVELIFAPAQVQGAGAAESVIAALDGLRQLEDLDCVILARGGGATEDLSAFDDEALLRALARFPRPVCCGVGHETDVSLADLIADLRAATPSQAAELCVPDASARRKTLAAAARALHVRVREHAGARRRRLDAAARLVDRRGPRARLDARRQRLDLTWTAVTRRGPHARLLQLRGRAADAQRAVSRAMARSVAIRRARATGARRLLDSMSPLAVLRRGYAIVESADGRVRPDAVALAPSEHARLRMRDGRVDITVDGVKRDG